MTEPTFDQIDFEQVLTELDASANGIDQAADELRKILPLFEGYELNGHFYPGAKLRWDELVGTELDRIVVRYEDDGKRPPAKDTLLVRAERKAKESDEVLWAEFHALRSRIASLQKWISAKRESVSARQSVLKAAGVIGGPNPQWSSPRQLGPATFEQRRRDELGRVA